MATRDRDIYDHRREAGEYIEDLRVKRGLTQRQLGDAIGMLNTVISAIELGRYTVPQEKYDQLADALGESRQVFAEVMSRYRNSGQAGAGAAT